MLPTFRLFPYKIQDLYTFKALKLNLVKRKILEVEYHKLKLRFPKEWKYFNFLLSEFPKLPQTSKTFGLGIEVEVESAPHLGIFGWKTIEEGSLRNNGKEYITQPIENTAVSVALSALYSHLLSWVGEKGEKVEFSWRTSIHVHLNVRDFLIEEVFKLLLLYIIFERVLFRFAGYQREQSVFCVPFRHSVLVSHLSGFCNEEYNIGTLQKTWDKYSAINLSRLGDYGTIEFRHLPGTADVNKIGNWVGLILSLAEAATTTSLEEIINNILSLNTTSKFDLFATTVFKPPFNKLLMAETTKDYEEGITACKEVLKTSRNIVPASGSVMERIINRKKEIKVKKIEKLKLKPFLIDADLDMEGED